MVSLSNHKKRPKGKKHILYLFRPYAAKYRRIRSSVKHVTHLGNNVMITSIIKINQTTFVHDEYAYLKEFFNQIIAKQAENIVIKKL